MKKMLLVIGGLGFSLSALAAPVKIVAAENFYGELAHEIGGNNVAVTSIISNPDADPHLFATSPKTSQSLAQAQIIIYNGADYDAWMEQMLTPVNKNQVIIINVADLMKIKPGANPHIWYQPATFPILAKVLADKIAQLEPASKAIVQKNLASFLADNQQVAKQIATVKQHYQGTSVTATEPVFGYMAQALGLNMKGEDFQWKIMNDSEPTPKMVANYQSLLTNKQVKVMFYNNQVTDSLTSNMQKLARQNGVKVVGVSETMPKDTTINRWLTSEINATATALQGK